MGTPQCPLEIVAHSLKGQLERCPAANEHVIMSGKCTWIVSPVLVREPHDFLQSAADPVAFDGITDLF